MTGENQGTPSPPDAILPSVTRDEVIRSEELFRESRQVLIRHADELYRLRITKTGKLILTK